jgi:rhodanese-related sulfurtransferase
MRLLDAFVLAMLLAACASSGPPPASPAPAPPTGTPPPAAASADRVDGAAAHALVRDGATLVDVRSPDEYAAHHLEGAINVPAGDAPSHDFGGKDKPVVLYCNKGHRSQQAGDALRSQGYTRVYVLGPMSAWGQ